jgi:zinc transport system substrate-binding protein
MVESPLEHRWSPAVRRCSLVSLLAVPLVLAGCGTQAMLSEESGGTQVGAAGADLEVVAAVYPLAWIAEQVAPGAQVDLLQGAQEAHDLDLSPPQRAAIETADVVLYAGDIDYQPQVEQAVGSAGGQVVSAAEVAGDDALLAASGEAHSHEEEPHEEEPHGEGAEGEHADGEEPHGDGANGDHAEEEAHGDDPHAEGSVAVDPHLWFDPAIMTEVALATGRAFSAADPDNARTYERNAADVAAELRTLAGDLEATLGGECRFDEVIVSHAAYGYLLTPFGKDQHAVTDVGAESDASAAELAEIVRAIRAEGFTHVLAEPSEGRDGAEAVVREAGVELLEIVPLESVTEEQAATGLPDLVRAQAASFATALGCT